MSIWLACVVSALVSGVIAFLLAKKSSAAVQAQLNERTSENAELNGKLGAVAESKQELHDHFESAKADLQRDMEALSQLNRSLSDEVNAFKKTEAVRLAELHDRITNLNFAIEESKAAKAEAEQDKAQAEATRLDELKKSWSTHEKRVEEQIKTLCQKHTVEYVDKENFPHRGKPDNSLLLCDEHIIFDSKCPQGDDPGNFPSYIKAQAESASKYLKDGVRRDLYFVVPTSAAPYLAKKTFELAGYRVYVITEDALEPVILALKKIEEYEFADKLDPADRETICAVLGKFAHAMKRRVQVDQFFSKEAMALLSESDKLPGDFLVRSREIEKSSKLNPPTDKRTKVIDLSELNEEARVIAQRAAGLSIDESASVEIKELPGVTLPTGPDKSL